MAMTHVHLVDFHTVIYQFWHSISAGANTLAMNTTLFLFCQFRSTLPVFLYLTIPLYIIIDLESNKIMT